MYITYGPTLLVLLGDFASESLLIVSAYCCLMGKSAIKLIDILLDILAYLSFYVTNSELFYQIVGVSTSGDIDWATQIDVLLHCSKTKRNSVSSVYSCWRATGPT